MVKTNSQIKLLQPEKKSEKFLLESSAETYCQQTPPIVYGNSKKHISVTTSYINQGGELPYVEIATKIIGSTLPPCKIKTSEKGLEFEAILMVNPSECDIIRATNPRDFFKTYEATKYPQIRDQLSAIEKVFQDKTFRIREHLSKGTAFKHNC